MTSPRLPRYSHLFVFMLVSISLIFCTTSTAQTSSGRQYKEDYSSDGNVNIADVIALLLYQRANPGDLEGDYNGDGAASITDAIALLLAIVAGDLTPFDQSSTSPYEPNNSAGEAYGPLESGQTYEAYIETPDDEDWYYFEVGEDGLLAGGPIDIANLPKYILDKDKKDNTDIHPSAKSKSRAALSSASIAITMTSIPQDYDIRLYDSEAEQAIAISSSSGTDDELIEIAALDEGRYYVSVSPYLGASDSTDSYLLTATWAAGPATGTEEQIEYVRNFAGTWEAGGSWGTLTIAADGITITGTYTHDSGRLEATLSADGRTMIGTWAESPSYEPPSDGGKITMVLGDDETSFSGYWWYGEDGDGSSWSATKSSSGEEFSYVKKFEGTWDAGSSWGTLTMVADGVNVTGNYTHDSGRLEATLSEDGETMVGTWAESPSYEPPSDGGKVTFVLGDDEMSFSGYWWYGEDQEGGSWSGTKISSGGDDQFEDNNEKESAYGPLVSDRIYEAYIGEAGDEDWYYFDVDGKDVSITLTSLPSDYDIALYDENEWTIASSVASGSSDEEITASELSAGRYYIRVYAYSSHNSDDSYLLQITLTEPGSGGDEDNTGPYEPNDLADNAFGPLVSGQTYEAYIETPQDIDWYYIDISSGSLASSGPQPLVKAPAFAVGWGLKDISKDASKDKTVHLAGAEFTVTLSSLPSDYDMKLYSGETESEIGSSSNSDTDDESIAISDLEDGRYYVMIYSYSETYSNTDSYFLEAEFETSSQEPPEQSDNSLYEPNNSLNEAYGPLDNSQAYVAYLEDSGDEDWYYFDLVGGGDLTISLTALPVDLNLKVYFQGDNQQVASSENSGTTSEQINLTSPSDGRYFISVTGNGEYSLYDSYWLRVSWLSGENVHVGTTSLTENANPESGAVLVLEDKATMVVAPSTFGESVTVELEETTAGSVNVSDEMISVSTPVFFDIKGEDGDRIEVDFNSDKQITLDFDVSGFDGDPEDLATVFIGSDSIMWFLEDSYDETSGKVTAFLPVNLIGSELYRDSDAQLAGLKDLWQKYATGVFSLGNYNCTSDATLKTAWDGPGTMSIMFIHGWQPQYQTCREYKEVEPFTALRTWLLTKDEIKNNFDFLTYHYPSYFGPDQNGMLLDEKIGGNTPTVIIAHSMGGLVTRWWYEEATTDDRRDRVKRIITCGTPHRGSAHGDGASMLLATKGTKSLKPDSYVINTLKSNEPNIEKDKYITYSGDIIGSEEMNQWSPWWAAGWKLGKDYPSDGIVLVTSAELEGVHKVRSFFGYNHSEMQDGNSGTPPESDQLFQKIYEDLKELITVDTIPNDIEFVTVPGGTFMMGGYYYNASDTKFYVQVSSFGMSKYEITNEQYAAFLNASLLAGTITVEEPEPDYAWSPGEPIYIRDWCYIEETIEAASDSNSTGSRIYYEDNRFKVIKGFDNHPVAYLSRDGVDAFCNHYSLRLPTEAEWEFAACGGRRNKGAYFFDYVSLYATDDGSFNCEKANANSCLYHTREVGSYQPNPYGLYDMTGNVSEWCKDYFEVKYYENYFSDGIVDSTKTISNPQGPSDGTTWVVRGGNLWSSRSQSEVDYRDGESNRTNLGSYGLTGFRVVRD